MSASQDQPRPSGRGGTYLLTWTTYGTWLPGDSRGFVSRVPTPGRGSVIHNHPGEPYDADQPRLAAAARKRMGDGQVVLSTPHARECLAGFRQVANRYGFDLYAGVVLRTHVHLLVASEETEGPRLLHLFKGVTSRRLGQRFGRRPGGEWWTRHGSRRLLPDGEAVERAFHYVMNQVDALVVFDEHGLAAARHECRGSGRSGG